MERALVASTAIVSVGYDGKARVLEIELITGDVYQYLDVPKGIYQDLITAKSKGRYLNLIFKPMGFKYRKM